MQATDLDSAVDALLSPPEGGTKDNLSEAVDSITEPNDDDHSDEMLADDEYEDVADASGDDDEEDAGIDTNDQVEATEATNLITVKIDGKEEYWTQDQLKQSAAGQGAINARFQELAQQKKELQQRVSEIAQREKAAIEAYERVQQGVMQLPQTPDYQLAESDPIAYMEQKARYDHDLAEYQRQQYSYQALQQQQVEQHRLEHEAYTQAQAKLLTERIPELADPQKSETHWKGLMETGAHYGFNSDEIMATVDARYIQMANDAMKYRRIVANRQKAEAKGQSARPVVKAGAKRVQDGSTATRKKQQQRLQKTGSIRDALSFMIDGNL